MICLERRELVCIPTLEETDRLQHHDKSEGDVLGGGMGPKLAQRYLTRVP